MNLVRLLSLLLFTFGVFTLGALSACHGIQKLFGVLGSDSVPILSRACFGGNSNGQFTKRN